MIAKKPQNFAAAVLAVILICTTAAGCAFSGAIAKTDPIDALQDSITFKKVAGSNTIAMHYTPPEGIKSIEARGRMMTEVGGISYHDLISAAPFPAVFNKSFDYFSELYLLVTPDEGEARPIDVLAFYKAAGNIPTEEKSNIPFTIFSTKGEAVTMMTHYVVVGDKAAILVPAEGWTETDNSDGSYLFTPKANKDVSLSALYRPQKTAEQVASELSNGSAVQTGTWITGDGTEQKAFSVQTQGGDYLDIYTLGYDDVTYAAVCQYSNAAAEDWGDVLISLARTLTPLTSEKYAIATTQGYWMCLQP